MRNSISIIILLLFSFSVCGQSIEEKTIQSELLNQERKLWIYTPWQYDEFPDKKLEVVYVFDAQAREMFDVVHSTLQFIGGEEYAFIVVGVESPYLEEIKQNRNTDFLPMPRNSETMEKFYGFAGGADKFFAYLREEVFTFMESFYRTLPTKVAIGHSNAGTFVSYCLLKDPDIFDAYISISPNYRYDEGQMLERFKNFNPETITSKKFFFISNADEEVREGWMEAQKAVLKILKSESYTAKIHLETMDFSLTENHGSTFPIGTFHALKAYINYQFRTGENVITYYDHLEKIKMLSLNPGSTNMFAYECFWNNKPEEALVIINWAIDKFPEDFNLYDSQGEFYEAVGNLEKAKTSYSLAIKKLENAKDDLDLETYEETLEYLRTNFERVNN